MAMKNDQATATQKYEILSGIELMRFLAAISILLIHAPQPDEFAKCADIFARWAVPFFFATSGFLAAGSNRSLWSELKRVAQRIGVPYIFWLIVYCSFFIDIGDQSPKDWVRILIFGGPAIHLWFLPALAVALITYRFLQNRSIAVLATTALILYVIGILLGPYRIIPTELPFNPRNGPFLSVPMVIIGAIYRRGAYIPLKPALALTFLSFLAYATEIAIFAPLRIDQVMTTILIGFAPLCVAVRMNSSAAWCAYAGKYTLGFYLLHVGVVTAFQRIFYPNSTFTYLAFVMIAAAFTFVVTMAISKVPYLRATIR
ncbi:acyltransferase [Sphingomonas zeae]